MKKIMLTLCLSLLLPGSLVFAKTITSGNVSLRAGMGAFFPVITVLNKGDNVMVTQSGDRWVKVKTASGKSGWVSAHAFNATSKKIDYGLMAQNTSKMGVSHIMVTAAVKGFFENRISDRNLNKTLFQHPYRNYMDPQAYLAFVNQTFRNRWSHQAFMRKNSLKNKQGFEINENLVATSAYIVGRLTAPGVTTNVALSQYVNNVARLIVDSTEYYDMPVCVHVVQTDKIFANSTPIGVIVVSRGMLNILKNESELACLLGHEISHVALSHGAIETAIRKPKIAAEKAFAELGEELGVDEGEAELDSMCADMYERAIKGRKAEYETAADLRGIVYARRAGYDDHGLVFLLKRLKTLIPVSRNPEDRSHWLPADIDKRIDILEKATQSDPHYAKFSNRYLRHTAIVQ